MKNEYKFYNWYNNTLTKEVLDSIEVGDYILCNDWKKPHIVIAKSKNYFIMICKHFKTFLYSICEKLPSMSTRNWRYEGTFSIGPDNYYTYYNYSNLDECEEALIRLEDGYNYTPLASKDKHPNYYDWEANANPISVEKGHLELSRKAVTLELIGIKKSKWNKNNIQEYLDKYFKNMEE